MTIHVHACSSRVNNPTGAPVKLFPWARIVRDYTPQMAGFYILFDGLLGVFNHTLQQTPTPSEERRREERRHGL